MSVMYYVLLVYFLFYCNVCNVLCITRISRMLFPEFICFLNSKNSYEEVLLTIDPTLNIPTLYNTVVEVSHSLNTHSVTCNYILYLHGDKPSYYTVGQLMIENLGMLFHSSQ